MNDKKEPVGGKTKKNLWTDKDKIKFIDKLAKGKIPWLINPLLFKLVLLA